MAVKSPSRDTGICYLNEISLSERDCFFGSIVVVVMLVRTGENAQFFVGSRTVMLLFTCRQILRRTFNIFGTDLVLKVLVPIFQNHHLLILPKAHFAPDPMRRGLRAIKTEVHIDLSVFE
jgi:hypothetical protein